MTIYNDDFEYHALREGINLKVGDNIVVFEKGDPSMQLYNEPSKTGHVLRVDLDTHIAFKATQKLIDDLPLLRSFSSWEE